MKIRELIIEGGNVWKNDLATSRINKKDVIPTVKALEKITGLDLVDNILGSAGKAETSGDIDIGLDATKFSKDELVSKLKKWADKNDPSAYIKKTGLSVHFRFPIVGDPNNQYIQVDFMFMPNINFAHWIYSPQAESKYKNFVRTLMIASLAKFDNLKFSTEWGLMDRATNTPLPNGTDPNVIAKKILGPKASAKDLSSAETILAALKDDPQKDKKLEDAYKTMEERGLSI